jgi:hypothetical protein
MSIAAQQRDVPARPKLRVIKAVPPNERPEAKQRRLMIALFREFVKENPKEAAEMVRELAPDFLSNLPAGA